MKTVFDPIAQRSPFAGRLVREVVSGATSGKLNPENDVDVAASHDRDMFVYVPTSGCPHAKQTQVLMVLRSDASEESAQSALEELGIAELAEKKHFIVVFPNPEQGGWNFSLDASRDNDADFITRCFAALPPSRGGVAGFNGMIFHLALDEASSAMACTLASTRPLDAAAIMVGGLPEGFELPDGTGAEQVAWSYGSDVRVSAWLGRVDGGCERSEPAAGVVCHRNVEKTCVCWFEGDGLSRETLALAWELMFSETRRWRNDTYGIYQPRIDFAEKGFVAHVADTTLGLADGAPRTWYEFVPEQIRGTSEAVPLVIYLHGINCCGLYGAEQSMWSAIAEREGFVTVFPDASIEMRWNVWDDPRLPSDMDYILALIDHMDAVHPIDRSRVYVSGFSMGSMFSNALAAAHPEVFAGVVAMNGPHWGYLKTLEQMKPMICGFNKRSVVGGLKDSGRELSRTHELADAAKQRFDYRMPFIQFVGALDAVGMPRGTTWPLTSLDAEPTWPETISFWRSFNHAGGEVTLDPATPTGLASDTCERVGERLVEQSWASSDEGAPSYYRFVLVERMPHAVDLSEVELGWKFVSQWKREKDGSLMRV